MTEAQQEIVDDALGLNLLKAVEKQDIENSFNVKNYTRFSLCLCIYI
jgi:hypothetical protein